MEEAISSLERGEITSSAFVAQAFDSNKDNQSNSSSVSNPQKALDLLNQRQRELERDLRAAVCANSDELLQNATDVKYLRDNVTNLKSQVMRVRKETENVASSLLEPFRAVQTASIQLNSMYSTCNKLRILCRFLSLTKQFYRSPSTSSAFTTTKKIDRVSSEIRGLCEIWRIAQGGELNNLVVFQKMWEKIKTNCDNLIKSADKQFSDSIEKLNVESATIAASVFMCLGTIQTVVKNNYYTKYLRNMNANFTKYDKCSADTIFSILQNDFQNAALNVTKISCIHESVSEAIRKASDPEMLIQFDIQEIDPLKSISEYSKNLKQILMKISNQYPNISNEIIIKIPNIRKEIIAFSQKLPPSIDQNSAFSIIAQVFLTFQESFIKQTSEEIKKLFFKPFLQSSTSSAVSIDVKSIRLNCESIQNRLLKLDSDLLWKFRDSIINLASQFVSIKKSPKDLLKKLAIKNQEAVSECLQAMATRLFSDDAATQIAQILESA